MSMANSTNEDEDISGITIKITRPVYSFDSFERSFNSDRPKNSDKRTAAPLDLFCRIRSEVSSRCNRRSVARSLSKCIPVFDHLRRYRWKQDFLLDLIAGLSAGVIHVPQGMGFALLAGLPPAYGLYTSFFPGLLYYLFGTSRHLSVGTMALTSMMVGAVVNRELPLILAAQGHENQDKNDAVTTESFQTTSQVNLTYSHEYEFYQDNVTSTWNTGNTGTDVPIRVSIAVSVTLIVGLVQIAMRLCQLGVLTTYMSVPFAGSFMVGAAIQIMVSQLPFQLGISIQRPPSTFQLPLTIYEVFRNITDANACAVVTSVICVTFLVGTKEGLNERYKSKLKFPIPVELIVVIVATLVSHFVQLKARYHLPMIGAIPTGFPTPAAPTMPNFTNYLADAVALAVISFAVSITMAQLMGRRHQYEIDTNQETLAYGIVNTVSPFFGCFVATQAPPRTMVHEAAGARTQLAGCLSIVLPLLVTLWIGPLFQSLPTSVLGCIVSCSLVPLLKQFGDLRFLWKLNRYDFFVWVITFLSTSMISVTIGLMIGIGVSIFFIALQAQLAKGFRTIPAKHTEIYYRSPSDDKDMHHSLEKEFLRSRIHVFRYDCGEICFVNAENFKRHLYSEIDLKRRAVSQTDDMKTTSDPSNKVETMDTKDRSMEKTAVISGPCNDIDHQNDRDKKLYDSEEHSLNGITDEPKDLVKANERKISNTELSVFDRESSSSSSSSSSSPPPPSSYESIAYGWPNPRHLILDLSTVCYVDNTGLNVIRQIAGDCKAAGVDLSFAVCNQRLSCQLSVFGLLARSTNQENRGIRVYRTVHDAATAAMNA